MRAIATIGASASGKSTWTRSFIEEQTAAGERWMELNKDELRMELLAARGLLPEQMRQGLLDWSYDPVGPDEKSAKGLLAIRLAQAVSSGLDGVIFSNTNLDGGSQARGQLGVAGADPALLETKLFPMGFDECVRRDAAREFSVGPAVIKTQFDKLSLLGLGFPEAPVTPNAARTPSP